MIKSSRLLNAELAGYETKKVDATHFTVTKTADGTVYNITKKGTKWVCDCPAAKYRGTCKHLQAISDLLPQRHPREKITAMEPRLHEILDGLGEWEIVGSYRRGKPDFKDVDILITCDAGTFGKIPGILAEDPSYVQVMAGPDIVRGKYEGYDLDINRVNKEEYAAQLLYRTGPKELNIKMRALAKSKGWRLSERGLLDGEGNIIARDTEESIFKALGLPYMSPEQREGLAK